MSNLCPLCKAPNRCEMSGSRDAPGDCWCMHINIPKGVLAKIPPDQVNRACICKACALQSTSHNPVES